MAIPIYGMLQNSTQVMTHAYSVDPITFFDVDTLVVNAIVENEKALNDCHNIESTL